MKVLIGAALLIFWTCSLRALTLQEAMESALQHNPQIQASRAALEKAAGNRLVLRAISFPDAGLIGVAGVQGGKRTEQSSTQAFGFVQGNFAQPLFNMAVPPSRRRGDLEILIAEQQLNVAVVEQLHQTRIAFYTALYNRSLESLRRSQAQQLEENIRTQQARFDAGTTDRGSVTAATVQARELDPQIETANRTYRGALVALAQAMGNQLGSGATLPSPEGELRRSGADSPHRSDDFISSEIRAGASYTWRVIDNGKVGGAALRQREISAINNLLLEQLEANVPRDLLHIQGDFATSEAREKSLSGMETLAQQNVRVVQGTMAQGLASQLELRDAENSLLAAREGLLSAAYQTNVTRAEWDRVTGRYFQFSDDTTANVH